MSGPDDPGRPAVRLGLAVRLSLLVLTSTGLIFCVAFAYNYAASKAVLLASAESGAVNLARAAQAKLEDLLNNVEPPVAMVAQAFGDPRYDGSDPLVLMRQLAEVTPGLFGVCAAFEPKASGSGRAAYAPYFSHKNGAVVFEDLATSGYDYPAMDWYLIPKTLGRPVWSEPYFDEGGGEIVMSTFGVPIFRGEEGHSELIGVASADISLDWLQQAVAKISILQSGFAFLISRNGTIVAHPNKALIMRESIFSLAEALDDPSLRATGRAMIRGETGFTPLSPKFLGKPAYVAYAPLPSNGWSVGVVVPEAELFAGLTRLHQAVTLIGAAGFLALLAIVAAISARIARPIKALARRTAAIAKGDLDAALPVARRNDEVGDLTRAFEGMRGALKEYISNLTEATKAKERMESELKIAKNIQRSFLPKRFPPFPQIEAFTLHAALEPAREVGGDLYDFFLVGEGKLFFIIGDVSGKGVPAALFMAVTKTLFKGIAEQVADPALVLDKVNQELVSENESMLFVTIFCGVLDFNTGELVYSNAGHPPPLVIGAGGEVRTLPVPEGLVLGVLEEASYTSATTVLAPGETLLAYTDGVTEAQDARGALYAEARLRELARSCAGLGPGEVNAAVMASVAAFAGGEPQADDITVLSLRYNGPGPNSRLASPGSGGRTRTGRLE